MDAITVLNTPDHVRYGRSFTDLDTSFDGTFKQRDGLRWLPWVGLRYQDSPTRLMLLGESNYNWVEDQAVNPITWDKVDEEVKHPHLTRIFVAKHALGDRIQARFSRNFERLVLNEAAPSKRRTDDLWRSSSYVNLVQRPMSKRQDRPQWPDYLTGWSEIIGLLDILKPRILIHAGTGHLKRAAFREAMKAHACDIQGESVSPPISRTYGMSCRLTTPLGHQVRIIMVMHPSSPRFSRVAWAGYVQTAIQDPTL